MRRRHPINDMLGERSSKAKVVEYQERPDGCWECVSHAPGSHGYPQIHWNGGNRLLHRVIGERMVDGHDANLEILHKCDNHKCINPKHMRYGTHADNMRDMSTKFRGGFGERAGNAVLTDALVYWIRKCGLDEKEISELVGCTSRNIRFVLQGKTWRHLL